MTTQECRRVFLDFFEQRGHKVRPSVSLISPDPTTLFTSAGMQPYMAAFRGQEEPPAPAAVSCQKCFRTGDIEIIGQTARHDTFFEMLGNFSFGAYFKQGAIDLAWELVTDVLGLPKEELWASVYEEDDEAADLWHKRVGIPQERILRLGRGDNWWPKERWEGPCGPCSELYVDLGPAYKCDNPNCKPGCDGNELCDRYLELWNLVFQMYTEAEDGTLTPLPKPGIDTGMGLERLALVMQPEARTIFETDEMRPILDYIFQLAADADGGLSYGDDENADVAARIITDHVRATTFLMTDGAMPSNEGAGYQLRRLIRRAYRYGRTFGLGEPFLHKIVPVVGRAMGQAYPELLEKQDVTVRILKREEQRFEETLDRGTEILQRALDKLEAAGDKALSGSDAFELYATYGFPIEMTCEIAAERGFSVDEGGFKAAMEEHARISATMDGLRDHYDVPATITVLPTTEFVGYRKLRCRAKVVAIIRDGAMIEEAGEGEEVEIVLDRTPFYAERGGQVGDSGELTARGLLVEVSTTYPWRETATVHRGAIRRGVLRVGATVTARVDQARRRAIQANHTATHLLHWALRKVLGEHAVQSGSVVDADRLRFDFAHYEAPSPEQLREIEALVNEKTVANVSVKATVMPFDEARKRGAIALFGEKYGDEVRVLQVGDFSKELCAGTHVSRTGDIGMVMIVHEGSVAAGTRRLEAVSGLAAAELAQRDRELLAQASRQLNCPPEDVPERLEAQRAAVNELQKRVERLQRGAMAVDTAALAAGAEDVNGVQLVAAEAPGQDVAGLRSAADAVVARLDKGVAVLGAVSDGKALLVAKASEDAVAAGAHAGDIIREVAKACGGGGGGKPEFAQAGGKQPDKLKDALSRARQFLQAQIGE